MKNLTNINQLEKAINKIKPISITDIYFYDGYNSTHKHMLKLWTSETESVDYQFNTKSEVEHEDIDYRVQLTNATPLELLTALF